MPRGQCSNLFIYFIYVIKSYAKYTVNDKKEKCGSANVEARSPNFIRVHGCS